MQIEFSYHLPSLPSLPPSLPPSLLPSFFSSRKPRRGIEYLISQTLIDNEPKSVAKFLKEHGGLSKEKIGEYLGEINSEFNMDVLE